MQQPKVLIITGYGVNCEAESAEAWRRAGANPMLVHVNDLLSSPEQIDTADGLMFIGGFSYGDHMTSGHVFAQRIKHHLQPRLQTFIDAGKVMLGICNGFQVMTKMGLLPGLNGDYFNPSVSLMQNDCGHFQNYWVNIRFEETSPCVFTKGLGTLPLPIRHGEGKYSPWIQRYSKSWRRLDVWRRGMWMQREIRRMIFQITQMDRFMRLQGYQIQLVEFWDDASSRSVSISGESSTMGCAETGRFAT